MLINLPSHPFQIINRNLMENINFLITNYLYADVNDQNWQIIKTYMKKTTGIDLSTSEIDIDNIYDTLKNLMAMNNPNELSENTVFKTVNDFLKCNDDAIILSLNLIIYSLLKSYKTLQFDNNEQENNNDNNVEDDEDEFDFNLINENKNKKAAPKNMVKTYLLINDFFRIDLTDDKSHNIVNYLFNYFSMHKVFRIATYEIMLINIQMITNIFWKK